MGFHSLDYMGETIKIMMKLQNCIRFIIPIAIFVDKYFYSVYH